jgi:two-component system, LytTR family, response regulator LytT
MNTQLSGTSIVNRNLRILVLEDERSSRDYLVELIERSGIANVVSAPDTAEGAATVIEEGSTVDAAFIDVNLCGSDRDGMSIIRAYAGQPEAPLFVLATALRDHALEAYELGVADYVTKPFSQLRVAHCLSRLSSIRRAPRPAVNRVSARRGRNLVFLFADDIWCVESAARLTHVHCAHGVYDLDTSLASVESAFPDRFVRVHRNWLANIAHIRELQRDSGSCSVRISSGYRADDVGIRVPVAKDRVQQLRDLLLGDSHGVRRR